jgi:UDP-N-acetyl-2-amino-2-deoxyglucuronate dehydrogenase
MTRVSGETQTQRVFRVALVGAGRIARNHFEAIAKVDGLELTAVADIDPERAREAGESQGVPWFRSFEEMLAQAPSDIIAVATPSGLHPRHGILAAHAGKHVVCEKPMAITLSAADELVQACDDAGVQLFVVKQNRLNATIQLVKRAIDKQRFGRIYMANCTVRWSRPQEYYDSAPWRGTWEFDGGALMNQASHYVDLVDWLIGPVESVQAYVATLARNIQVEDTATVGVRWRSGALGSINVTMLTYPRNFEGSITIIGERGTARVGGVAVNDIQHWEFAERDPQDDTVRSASYQTASVYGTGHTGYYANAVKVMRGEAEPETDGREGLRSLELLIASYLSARDGRRMALPLEY